MLGATHGGKTELQTAEGGDEPPRIHVAQPHRITNSDFGNIAGRPWFRYPPVWARLKTGTTAGGHFWSKNRTAKDNPQFVVELERPTSLAISVSQVSQSWQPKQQRQHQQQQQQQQHLEAGEKSRSRRASQTRMVGVYTID